MQLYSGIISNTTIERLKYLLGKNLYIVYSPGIKVSNSHIQSESFSIPVFGDDWQNVTRWINFESRHVDSMDEQYFNHLEISSSDSPYKIEVKEEAGKKSLLFPYSSYVIKMESGWEIEAISIFRKEEKFISFKHSFDYAIIFLLPNNREICFFTEETTENTITLTEDNSIIDDVKKRGFKISEIK